MPRPPFRPDRPIVLVGMMGAGKSTVGRRLARRLGLPFLDADEEVERAAGLSVAEIFQRHGEAAFRDSERRVVARLVAGPASVIATGGGAFVDAATRALVLERCTAVWLDAPPPLLAERASRRGCRPLLDGSDPLGRLADLAERRRPIYAEAPIRIESGPVPHETVVDRIVAALAERRP